MKHQKFSIFISHPSEFLTNCQPHGDGLIAFNFINQLAQRGHTLHVAAPATAITGELPANIKIYPVKTWTSFSTLNPLEYIIKVRQIFNRIQQNYPIDIIHQLNPVNPGLSYSLLGTGLPIVLGPFWVSWRTDIEPPKFKTSLLGGISSYLVRPLMDRCSHQQQKKASALLLSTPAALPELYDSKSSKNKIHTITPGINPTLFSPVVNEKKSQTDPINILFMSHVEPRKGIFTLLDAFEIVNKYLDSCQLIIGGAGTALEEVKRRVSAMSCRSQISLLGKVERDQVPKLMRQCTVFCLPSYGEPFGMSALEAMACGKPVVATDAGGLAYLVPALGGRKVPPKDSQALADALIEILSSPELQTNMGQYNRQLVEETYKWQRVIDRLEAIYQSLVNAKNK
jgi:L-malate glycosyltransferase